MTTRFRVVDHAATGQRYRTVRLPGQNPQYMSAAQAALRSQLTGEQSNPFQSNFSPTPMNPTPGGGSDGASAVAAMAGLPGRPSAFGTHKGRHGFPVPNIFNPIGPGTHLGSVLQMSDAGRLVAGEIGAQYPGPGGQLDPFAVGGRLYGRGTALQRVSTPPGSDPNADHWVVPGWDNYRIAAGAVWDTLSGKTSILPATYRRTLQDLGKLMVKVANKISKDPFPFAPDPLEYPVGPDGPVSPSPLDPSVGGAGYYPTMTPEQSGGHAMSSALLLDTLAEAYRRMQEQAHLPAGSDAGGGGGTSTAPERLFLHGKHTFSWVALNRPMG